MKKITLLIFGVVGLLLTLSWMTSKLQAEPALFEVNFQAMFDEDNPGSPTAIGTQSYGSTINLETTIDGAASPTGDYVFAFFVVNGVVRSDLPQNHTFVITGPLSIIAVYSKPGENAVLFMDSNAKLIGVDYVLDTASADDSTLTLPDKPGYVVSSSAKWNGSMDNIITDTVLILQYDKSTTATFTLSVTNGSGDGIFNFNEVVTVTPEAGGTPFSHWVDETGIVLSTVSTYSFTMLEDKEIVAKYSETPLADIPRIILSKDLGIRAGYRSYLSQFYLPIGYTLLDYGMYTLTEDQPIENIDTPNLTVYKGFKYYAVTDEFLMSIPTASHYSARAYLVVKDSDGLTHHYYSERNEQYVLQGPIDLKSAYDFTLLSKTGISTTGLTEIHGNVGVSPAASTYLTGFGLVMDSSNQFSTSSLVVGNIYAPNYAVPTPTMMTTAISDMEAAYTDGAGRAPDYVGLYAGNIGGQTLAPGVYKWTTSVTINNHITLNGSATDTWIFIISGNVSQAADVTIILSGGAVAENIVWVVAGLVDIGARAHFEGTILCMTSVHFQTSATLNGRILSQTAITLDGNKIN